jgi:hypothetical protein
MAGNFEAETFAGKKFPFGSKLWISHHESFSNNTL